MKLNFTLNENISDAYPVDFNQISVNIRKTFTECVDSISKNFADKIDWWVSSPASRNVALSPLFYYCCCLFQLKKLNEKHCQDLVIITDSKALKNITEKYLTDNRPTISLKFKQLPFKQRLIQLLKIVYIQVKIPLSQLLLHVIVKVSRFLSKTIELDEIILIDTFISPGFIEKDRYYTGMTEALSDDEKKSCYFVPLLIGFRPWHFLHVVKKLRESRRNLIFKEDYLKIRDYFFAWGYTFRTRFFKKATCRFQGFDIWPLVREELNSLNGFESSFAALLNYRFAKRLSEKHVPLKLVVDWFENQSVDRGWNAGFRKFFPTIKTIGYLGFISNAYPYFMHPTEEEMKNKVIPQEIYVIGKNLVGSVKRFCMDINVKVAPAFRFQGVWKERRYYPPKTGYTVCVALPARNDEASHIFRLIVEAKRVLDEQIRFIIKPHPAVPVSQIIDNLGEEISGRFEFIDGNGDFNDWIEKSHLLISSGSSTCTETIVKGIPVIVVLNRSSMNQNPIPDSIPKDIWRVCYSSQELINAVLYFAKKRSRISSESIELCRSMKQKLFAPVTRKGVREFLNFEGRQRQRQWS